MDNQMKNSNDPTMSAEAKALGKVMEGTSKTSGGNTNKSIEGIAKAGRNTPDFKDGKQ